MLQLNLRRFLFLFLFPWGLFGLSGPATAALPSDAQALLDQFPKKMLPLPFVFKMAMEKGDQFKAARAGLVGLPAAVFAAHAPLEAVLYAGSSFDWNRNRPTTPFGSLRQDTKGFSLGFRKSFFTGTSVGIELTQSHLDLDFGPVFGSQAAFQAQTKLTLSQSLIKNFFGDATRAGLESAEAGMRAQALEIQDQIESLLVGTAQVFYSAWSQQAQVRNSLESLERRERLFKVVQARFQRGVAEKPDYLSAQSSLTQSRIALSEQKRQLRDLWVNLVNSLKFPAHWREIDPYEVPLEPFEEIPLALGRCAQQPSEFRADQKARLQLEQVRSGVVQAQSQIRPDLSLSGSINGNGVVLGSTDQFLNRWQDSFTFRNPWYTVAVNLNIPLNQYAERAALTQAVAQRDRVESTAAFASVDVRQRFDALCSELKLLKQSLEDQRMVVDQTQQRVTLEEERYRHASQTVYTVIQAGDELSLAQFQLRLYDVRARVAAWNLIQLSGMDSVIAGVQQP